MRRQKHYLPLHMEAGVPTIADIQPRFWTQQRTAHCFQLGHHHFCLFSNAMKTFYQVHGNFPSSSSPPPTPHTHTRQKLFRFMLWIQRNEFDRNILYTGNLVYAIVFPMKSYSLHLTGSHVILSQYIPVCIEVGSSAS